MPSDLVLLVVLARLCAGAEGTGGSNQASTRMFTKDDYAELATDPNSFKGASVDIEGRLLKQP